jgi:transcription antitermination factor NusG
MRRRPSRAPTVEVLLFPGYVFVQPKAEQFEAMHYIRGSCGLVLAGTRPAAMPARELEALRKMIGSGAPLAVVPQLMRGRRAVVVEGPIAGVRGEVIRVSSQDHLVINAGVVGYSVSVPVDSNKIRVL